MRISKQCQTGRVCVLQYDLKYVLLNRFNSVNPILRVNIAMVRQCFCTPLLTLKFCIEQNHKIQYNSILVLAVLIKQFLMTQHMYATSDYPI